MPNPSRDAIGPVRPIGAVEMDVDDEPVIPVIQHLGAHSKSILTIDYMTTSQTAAVIAEESVFTIAEACAVTGTSSDTLRYSERAATMPTIRRNSGGHRIYSSEDVGLITFVRLRATGMKIQRIAEYTTMGRQDEGTIADRRRILDDHRATVTAAVDELTTVLEVPVRHANQFS